jgi:putative flippase GtrA
VVFSRLFEAYLLESTSNPLIQLFRCIVAGLISFVVDASLLYIITEIGVYYLLSAVMSFCAALYVNFILARKFIFKKSDLSYKTELVCYVLIAVVGLALTEILLYLLTEKFKLFYLVSKFLAAVIVMLWTFTARKYFLYREIAPRRTQEKR